MMSCANASNSLSISTPPEISDDNCSNRRDNCTCHNSEWQNGVECGRVGGVVFHVDDGIARGGRGVAVRVENVVIRRNVECVRGAVQVDERLARAVALGGGVPET